MIYYSAENVNFVWNSMYVPSNGHVLVTSNGGGSIRQNGPEADGGMFSLGHTPLPGDTLTLTLDRGATAHLHKSRSMDAKIPLNATALAASAGFAIAALAASWLTDSHHLLNEGHGLDAAAIGFLACATIALAAIPHIPRRAAAALSTFIIVGIA
jgi:hypothetical protein